MSRTAAMTTMTTMTTMSSAVVVARIIVLRLPGWVRLLVWDLSALRLANTVLPSRSALDNLVEFAAIEPHAPAFGAIVDFYALALAHDQIDLANGTE